MQDTGAKLHRRSLYTIWKRTVPPPAMVAFDAPNREVCTAGREVTNTPLQALVLLNDPQFVEASRNLAQAALKEAKLPSTLAISLRSRSKKRRAQLFYV